MAVKKSTVVYWVTLIASLALNALQGGEVVPPVGKLPVTILDTCPPVSADAGK